MYKDEVGRIMGNWVPDTGTSISRDTKYMKAVTYQISEGCHITLYWHMKALMGKALGKTTGDSTI